MISSMIGTSRVITRSATPSGVIRAVAPRIRPMFARLEPTTFPIRRPPSSRRTAKIPTTSSGADVPRATRVSPTTTGLMPIVEAMRAAPRTSHSAPK